MIKSIYQLPHILHGKTFTRSMVYKGMVYKGQYISSTEDFWENKDIQ